LKEALETFEIARRLNQKDPMIMFYQGITLKSLGRRDEALYCYDRSLQMDADDPEIYNEKASLLMEMKK
jgi:Flp pilus assembly protein TadD